MNLHVVRAIFRRNFVAYFSNPTGYVFICLFVLLSGVAAFWPTDFFNANLANLDQLNRYFPFIMLVFIPAITMSVWAEERRQGTDELLLTIPASDFDVVVGKYLAAEAIFTVSLLFSLFNVVALSVLGKPDWGLLAGTYVGYWLVGLAMLAVGMSASFLTGNLTVGFILGALFNAPLAFASRADALSGSLGATLSAGVRQWSLAEQFRDFGRGVVSLSGVAYFVAIVAVMLYVCVILIGRRHWLGGRDGQSLIGHYFARGIALIGIAIGSISLLARHDARVDVTSEQLSSLSPQSVALVEKVDPSRPVRIEAFISPHVPESYVTVRLNLLSTLRELEARAPGRVLVSIHDTEPLSAEAQRAEEQFEIKGQRVSSRTRGAMNVEDIFLGVACSCELDRVVVPFVDRGTPIEYELVRSIATLSQQQRKKVGVLTTDAKLYGGFDMQSMSSTPNEQIIEELEKQYEVVQVNADSPITEKYDVLLAVQPSSLSQQQLDNFLAAMKSGQPTAVFEDPFPYLDSRVPATSAPKQPQGGMMMNQGPPPPKGNIAALWSLLGVSFSDRQVVWQNYNPYPKIAQFPKEFVFVDDGAGQREPFEDSDDISSKLQQMLFLFPGFLTQANISGLDFTPLVRTGEDTGVVAYDEVIQPDFLGRGGELNPARFLRPTGQPYVLAAHIHGKLKETIFEMSDAGYRLAQADAAAEPATGDNAPAAGDNAPAESAPGNTAAPPAGPSDGAGPSGGVIEAAAALAEPPAEPATPEPATPEPATPEPATPGEAAPGGETKPTEKAELNVVLVADIDCLYSAFFALRSRGDDPEAEVNLALDNVTFVLNVLDVLSRDDRFVEIRKRRPVHRTLTAIDQWTSAARENADKARGEFFKKFEDERTKEQSKLDGEIEQLRQRNDVDSLALSQMVQSALETGQRRLEKRFEQLKQNRDRDIKKIEQNLAEKTESVQDAFKMVAVLLPPVLPLLLGVAVYFNRRSREKEGVQRSRLR